MNKTSICICQVTARALPNLEEDGRLLPMLNNLSKRYLGQDYDLKKIRTGEITADMVDGVSILRILSMVHRVHITNRISV